MSAASPAASSVRRPVPTAAATRQAVRPASRFDDAPKGEDGFRLQLGDIPRIEESMDVEGFKPSLLSRLFDLVAPIKHR